MAQTSSSRLRIDSELLKALVDGDRAKVGQIGNNIWSPCQVAVAVNRDTALHLVARRGHLDLVDDICQRAPSLVAECNTRLDTPLHCAARAGHSHAVDRLIRCARELEQHRGGGGEPVLRMRNREGATALYEAVRHEHAAVVKALMQADPELADVTNKVGISPLYLAAMAESDQMVNDLLPSHDPTLSATSYAGPEGRTALHAAAFVSKAMAEEILKYWKPRLEKWKLMLTGKQDNNGSTALHYAVSARKPDVVSIILEHDTSIAYISDNSGLFPVHIAAMMGYVSIIDQLMENCANCCELIDDQGRNFLHYAIENRQVNVVQHVCENPKFIATLNATDYEGNTPLHLAIQHKVPTMAFLLLAHKDVNISITNMEGLTPRDLILRWDEFGSWIERQHPCCQIDYCLDWVKARLSPRRMDYLLSKLKTKANSEEELEKFSSLTRTRALVSVLITTVTFTAGLHMPEGYKADTGARTLARRFGLKAFVLSNTAAFAYSSVATCLLVYGGISTMDPADRRRYHFESSEYLWRGVQCMMAAFALGVNSVLLSRANRWITIVVGVLAVFCVWKSDPKGWRWYAMKSACKRLGLLWLLGVPNNGLEWKTCWEATKIKLTPVLENVRRLMPTCTEALRMGLTRWREVMRIRGEARRTRSREARQIRREARHANRVYGLGTALFSPDDGLFAKNVITAVFPLIISALIIASVVLNFTVPNM